MPASESNPYQPTATKVVENYRETPENFTLTLSARFKHEPGQFVQVYLPRIGECPISICSTTGQPLTLHVRQVGNMTTALAKLKKGDEVFVRGPYGRGYPMDQMRGKDLIIVGGGCGVAPLKSVIGFVEENHKEFGKLDIYLGFRNPGDVLFTRDQRGWKKRHRLNVSVDQAPPGVCYEGHVGFVTEMLQEADLPKRNTAALLCGPPKMLGSCVEILRQKGFRDTQIYVSAERLMYCGVGRCCHCMIKDLFTCKDGPVFRYDELSGIKND